MNPLIKIFIYPILSVLIGALLAPIFYEIIVLLPTNHWGFLGHFLSSVQQMPFHRYVSRTIQIAAFVLLWPTVASLKIKRLSDLSLYRNRYAWEDFWRGIAVAILPLWLLELFLIDFKWYLFDGFCSWRVVLKILATAFTVALLEEFLFRGVLLGLSRRFLEPLFKIAAVDRRTCLVDRASIDPTQPIVAASDCQNKFLKNEAAIVLVALLFAGVHFLNLSRFNEPTISWWSGFSLLCHIDHHWSTWSLAVGAFGTLFLLGVILGWVTVRTRSLWLAIGLHAGWIVAQQLFRATTHENFSSLSLLPWWGSFQIYGMVPVGLLVLLPVGVTSFLVSRILAPRTDPLVVYTSHK